VRRGDTRDRERTVYRIAVGCANLALAAMLIVGAVRFAGLIPPKYGDKFSFFTFVMLGLACWMVVRGFIILFGRSRGAS
jgi:hypothetical protein